jgi:hypothetical protein
MQFSSLPINSSLQNNPRYQFSLKSENIEILPILSAAILKMVSIRSRLRPFGKWRPFARDCGHFENGVHSLAIFFGQNILPTLLNIYAKFCGNPFDGFRYK